MPLGILNEFLAKSNDLKKMLLHYREVLHYRELIITLLEQNIIIDIFQNIPIVFMAAILKIGIRTPLGKLNRFLAKSNDLKTNIYYIIGQIYYIIGKYYIIG